MTPVGCLSGIERSYSQSGDLEAKKVNGVIL